MKQPHSESPHPEPQPPGSRRPRLAGIDLLRGAVMVVMLLDHTRDFVHVEGLTRDPTDLQTSTPALFFTRWITHFCAPVFVFLAGLSVHLQLLRGTAQLARHLVQRGLFLVVLELVVLRPLIWFHFEYSMLAHLQVIWAIGWSMCGLGLLLRVPAPVLGVVGLAIVAGHNLLPHVPFGFASPASGEGLRILLVGRGGLQFGGSDGPVAFAQYAVLPWFGVMLLGYWGGALWALPASQRRRWLLLLGSAALLAFGLLRGLHLYGDPFPWSAAASGWRALGSFLRVEKYPPSLQYCLMTLGPALLVLAASEGVQSAGRWRLLVTIGRVPLFFYVLQWPTVHLVSRLFQWLAGQPVGWDAPNVLTLESLPPGCGFTLPVVYLAWGMGLLVLVPLSVWFEHWQGKHPERRWLRWL